MGNADYMNRQAQRMKRKPQPTPAVAKIAAEVAADLEDYVVVDQGGFGGPIVRYRTADAQEMIERAFAGLEAELEQAREELKAYREGGLTEEILRRNDGYIKVGKDCAIVVAKEQP